MPQIFISHSDEDAEFGGWLKQELQRLGHHIAGQNNMISAGGTLADKTQQLLDQADFMVCIISPEALSSKRINTQWWYHAEHEKKIIPLRLKPVEYLPWYIAALQSIDFYNENHDTALSRLHNTLTATYNEAQSQLTDSTYADPNDNRGPRWTEADEYTARQAGIEHVYKDFPVNEHKRWLQNAHSRVRVLNTWTRFYADYPETLTEVVAQGAHVQLLLLDPSSPFAKQRSLDLQSDGDENPLGKQDVPKNIRANIRQFASIYPLLAEYDGELELGLYNALPSLSIHQVDNRALIGFFPHHVQTTGFLLLEIRMDSPFGRQIDIKFNRMWNDATLIDPVPPTSIPTRDANKLPMPEPLSERELEILCLKCEGLTNPEIAAKLVVALSTVKKHINNMYSKLGVSSPTQASRKARELGLC